MRALVAEVVEGDAAQVAVGRGDLVEARRPTQVAGTRERSSVRGSLAPRDLPVEVDRITRDAGDRPQREPHGVDVGAERPREGAGHEDGDGVSQDVAHLAPFLLAPADLADGERLPHPATPAATTVAPTRVAAHHVAERAREVLR